MDGRVEVLGQPAVGLGVGRVGGGEVEGEAAQEEEELEAFEEVEDRGETVQMDLGVEFVEGVEGGELLPECPASGEWACHAV